MEKNRLTHKKKRFLEVASSNTRKSYNSTKILKKKKKNTPSVQVIKSDFVINVHAELNMRLL